MTQHNNLDPEEIAKFEQLAYRWWDKDSEFKPLHDINPLRLDFINKHAPLNGSKVLDVGCGGGILTESMAASGAHVKGIDLGKTPLSVAQLHAKENNYDIHYELISAEDIAQREPQNYDVITCLEMLEHVPDPASIIEACSRLLKPGGHVFFSTINKNPKAYLFAILGAEYILNLLPRGTHDYSKFIRPSQLDQWCRHNRLTPGKITGMSYNPITGRYHLCHDVSVNYLLYAQKAQY